MIFYFVRVKRFSLVVLWQVATREEFSTLCNEADLCPYKFVYTSLDGQEVELIPNGANTSVTYVLILQKDAPHGLRFVLLTAVISVLNVTLREKLLIQNEFSFLKQHSTEYALTLLYGNVSLAIDNRVNCRNIY